MDEYVKQALSLILHKRMQAKAELEKLRFMEQTDRKKSYKKEINLWLDRLNELNELFEKIKNQ
jgi:Arc/MetJ-type ribon-helix-helix transcriptional regulator